jgi:hypothetical protein
MAGAGAKKFPAFSKLASDDVNNYLADQVIMRFATTTARDAAFGGVGEPTLAEGMTAYIDADNSIYTYDGSNWVKMVSASQPPAMQLVGTFTAGGISRALVCDNVFTTDYANYKVVVKLGGVTNTNWLYFQFIDTNGATVTASYFSTAYLRDFTAGGTSVGVITTTGSVPLGYVANGIANPTGAEVTIYGARLNEWTTVNGQTTGVSSGAAYQAGEIYATCNPSPNTLRGLRFDNIAGTNITGTVSIYGYRA